jgi:RNA polymerase sigma-70 factor (ECF subfamily)
MLSSSGENEMQMTIRNDAGEKPQMNSNGANAQQFDHVLSRYLPSLHRMAFRKLGNAVDAEDAVQEALLSAYKHLDQFNGGAQMSTWLTTIVINAARMQLRRRSRHVHLSLDEPLGVEQESSLAQQLADDGPSPEDVCRQSELHEHVRQLLPQLSPRLRKVFRLRELDGLTTQEAALILGVPSGTVKAQLLRARAKLRELMRRQLDAQIAPTHTNAAISVATIRSSATRDQDHRTPSQRRALRGQVPASLEADRKVA